MGRGNKDFESAGYLLGNSTIDNADLVAMQLGVGLLDGLGRTVVFDTFGKGFGMWNFINSGVGVLPLLANAQRNGLGTIYVPPYSVECDPKVAAGDISGISTSAYLGTQSRLGIEVGFIIGVNMPDLRVDVEFAPTNQAARLMRIVLSNNGNSVLLNTGASTQNVGTFISGGINTGSKIQMKLTGDWTLNKYQKLLVNENVIPVSTIPLGNSGAASLGGLVVKVYNVSYGAGSSKGFIGYVRLTKDEP